MWSVNKSPKQYLSAHKVMAITGTDCSTADCPNQGMFLFAKVVMDNLAEQGSPSDLRNELRPEVFPHKLEEAYVNLKFHTRKSSKR